MPEATPGRCADCATEISPRAIRCLRCKRKEHKRRSAERNRRPCEGCGRMFAPTSQRSKLHPQRFCSPECCWPECCWPEKGRVESTPVRYLECSDGCGSTLDHVIPLARGGEHSYSNVRCAHYWCNAIKTDREYPLATV